MIIRNEETGLALQDPPEFGRDGAWPPMTTAWTPLRWGLFKAESNKQLARFAYDVVNDPSKRAFAHTLLTSIDSHEGSFAAYEITATDTYEHSKRLIEPATRYELRRLVHAERWQRNDPVIQLSARASYEVTHSVTIGLTAERSRTLSKALGLNLGGNVPGIQAEISSLLTQEFGLRLAITAQQEKTKALRLSGQETNPYTKYALWHIDHRITVSALELLIPPHLQGFQFVEVVKEGISAIVDLKEEDIRARWVPRGEVEFVTSDDPVITTWPQPR